MCIPLYLPTFYIHVTVCILSSSDKSTRFIHWFTFLKAHASVEWLMGRISMAGLSVDGDSQGVERLQGALSAYMWPGMVLKSGDKINEPSLPQEQGFIC